MRVFIEIKKKKSVRYAQVSFVHNKAQRQKAAKSVPLVLELCNNDLLLITGECY